MNAPGMRPLGTNDRSSPLRDSFPDEKAFRKAILLEFCEEEGMTEAYSSPFHSEETAILFQVKFPRSWRAHQEYPGICRWQTSCASYEDATQPTVRWGMRMPNNECISTDWEAMRWTLLVPRPLHRPLRRDRLGIECKSSQPE